MIIKHYSYFISAGIILWIISFILLFLNLYPYVFFIIYPSPILIILGVIGWIRAYKQEKGKFPNPVKSIKESISKFSGIFSIHMGINDFIFGHFLHWITFWFLCWISIMFIMHPVYRYSSTFNIASEYLETDKKTNSIIGRVKYYGLFPSGSIKSDGDGKINLTVIGEIKTINVSATIENNEVVKLEYK